MEGKSIYTKSNFNIQIALWVLSLVMIATSIYLTSHYFDLHFPENLSNSNSLCNISSYFNCNGTTLSPASNIFGVPVSIPGLMLGLLILLGMIVKDIAFEKTIYSILIFNALGCLVLFFYSIFAVGGLCPMCSVYYIASFITLFLFFKHSPKPSIDPKFALISALVFLLPMGGMFFHIKSKTSKTDQLAASLMKQFDSYPNLGKPDKDSPLRLATATENFADAPVRITVFSDFQCPACAALSKMTHQIALKYPNDVNIQYVFYPLDHNCNSEIKRPFHTYACQAAYLAYCSGPKRFDKVHDEIFKNQNRISQEWLNNYAKTLGVTECMKDEATKNKVIEIIETSRKFKVASTPTMLVNGIKIEGVFPPQQMYILIEELIKRSKSGKTTSAKL